MYHFIFYHITEVIMQIFEPSIFRQRPSCRAPKGVYQRNNKGSGSMHPSVPKNWRRTVWGKHDLSQLSPRALHQQCDPKEPETHPDEVNHTAQPCIQALQGMMKKTPHLRSRAHSDSMQELKYRMPEQYNSIKSLTSKGITLSTSDRQHMKT